MVMTVRRAARLGASTLSLLLAAVSAGHAETLADAVSLAYANNPDLQAQRAAQQAVDETYVQARAAYGPQAQVSGGSTYEKVRGSTAVFGSTGQESSTSGQATLSVSQSLYSGGRNRAAVSAAEANILGQRETVRQTEIQVLQQVVSSYVAVRRDIASVQVYRDTVQALERQLKQVEAEFAVRQVTRTDVDETIGRIAVARANAASAQAQLEISRSQYLQVVGENPSDLTPEPALEVFENLDAAFDAAEANNPALNVARYQEQAARIRVAQAKANYLPSVSAQVQLQRSAVEPYSTPLGEQTALIGEVTVTQPLYTSGLYTSQVRETLAQVNQARASIEAARRTAVQAVAQAWSGLVAARTSIVADENGVTATQAAFYGARREQPFDLRQPIDVLNAEQELNNAQVRLIQDRYNEYVARANLLAAAGVLDVASLSPQTPRIKPETSFNKIKDKNVPPFVGILQALDSIGIPGIEPPRPAVRDEADRDNVKPSLPPAPLDASRTPPLKTATSIMEAESNENGDVVAPTAPASTDLCARVGGRLIGNCLPQDAKTPN
jgi:outer membrane protein